MDNEFMHESQDIVIGNDCGRFVVSVKVGMGSEDMVTLPVAVWNLWCHRLSPHQT